MMDPSNADPERLAPQCPFSPSKPPSGLRYNGFEQAEKQ